MLLGIALIVIKIYFEKLLEKIPFISTLNLLYTIIIGAVLIIVGFFLLKTRKSRYTAEEVPIFHGKRIIGYRKK